MRFSDFALSEPILKAVSEEGYDTPTPIQQQAITPILEGRDVLGCAQTGTGKTAAFALPILENLARSGAPRGRRALKVLVLSPTRELASQIGDSFATYGKNTGLRHTTIFGGVNQNRQIDALERGVDILVATPGRLLDLMNQRLVSLADLTVFVLDEADRMLDMGFVHDVRKIAAQVPKERQTLLFSATMPESIRALANSLLRDPVQVAVTPVASTADTVEQSIYFVEKGDKRSLLSWVLERERIERAIVFTRTKHGANRVAEYLEKKGVSSAAIHGNKSQNARERALEGFKQGRIRALIATDIAARGIDIDELGFVINFDLPNVPEAYVHRIGRTGRAGASGVALSFCEQEERPYLVDIERLIKKHIPVVLDQPYPSPLGVPKATDLTPRHGRAAQQSARGNHEARPPRPPQRSDRGPAREYQQTREARDSRDARPAQQQRPAPRSYNEPREQRPAPAQSQARPRDEQRVARSDDQRVARHNDQRAQPRDQPRANEPQRRQHDDRPRQEDRRGHAHPRPDQAHRQEPAPRAHRDRPRDATR